MQTKICVQCKKVFEKTWKVGGQNWIKRKFCSNACRFAYGTPWYIGNKLSKKHIKRICEGVKKAAKLGKFIKPNELNHNWKGDEVSYRGLHDWVRRHLGKAKKCNFCGIVGNREKRILIEWASKSHKAKRDLSDYISLCVPCHRKYDRYENPNSKFDRHCPKKVVCV